MKKILLSISALLAMQLNAQTTLYSDDFETNGTFIMSSTVGNQWTINDVYTGGTFNIIILGVPFPITVPSVPAQPVAISNTNGKYLHPMSTEASNNGVECSSYDLITSTTGSMMAAMTSQVNTTGYENVTLNLWRTGGNGGMKILYRVNGGGWIDSGHSLTGNPTDWQQESFTIPAGDDVSQFSIAFEFSEPDALDPAPNHYHSIDEISITGDPISTEELTASIQNPPSAYCGGDDISVDYSGNGTYNAANEFQLELSDDAGDFTTSTVIGTVASTNGTGTITGTIPTSVTSGTGYRVRVVSTDNAFTGDDNGTDLTMHPQPAAPTITQNGTDLQSSFTDGNQWFMDGSPISGANNQDYSATESGSYTVVHTSTDGCVSEPSAPIDIDFSSVKEMGTFTFKYHPNPFSNELNLNSNGEAQVTVVDVTGKLILEKKIQDNTKIKTQNWNSGVYFMTVRSGDTVKTHKILKN